MHGRVLKTHSRVLTSRNSTHGRALKTHCRVVCSASAQQKHVFARKEKSDLRSVFDPAFTEFVPNT